jgi:hypothetical protein
VTTTARPVTRTCTAGNHSRCLGTVYDPASKGLVPCECPVADCGHGTDTVKARRGKR